MNVFFSETHGKKYLEKFWVPLLKSKTKRQSLNTKVSIEKKFKHKTLRKEKQQVLFDELGQLGDNSKGPHELVGFITSGSM
jgi:hypothetical protein